MLSKLNPPTVLHDQILQDAHPQAAKPVPYRREAQRVQRDQVCWRLPLPAAAHVLPPLIHSEKVLQSQIILSNSERPHGQADQHRNPGGCALVPEHCLRQDRGIPEDNQDCMRSGEYLWRQDRHRHHLSEMQKQNWKARALLPPVRLSQRQEQPGGKFE